ncbi:Fc.00g111150.m01.CDS01 [Cosmosporella sp. VM-42]
MARTAAARKYGKPSKRTKAERLFAELPQSPIRMRPEAATDEDELSCLTEKISSIKIEDGQKPRRQPKRGKKSAPPVEDPVEVVCDNEYQQHHSEPGQEGAPIEVLEDELDRLTTKEDTELQQADVLEEPSLRVLTWDDVCPPDDRIVKIAEASYAEVYRVTNDRGTSIIKVIRLPSPIKALTKAQVRAELVDEEPHSEEDVKGELQISEWLADIPGFVVYKERYVVQGKATRQLLETHQAFQKRMKRQDPDRAQFYPSPSRYLGGTRFLVVELGDAGTALEDWKLETESQLWDIFFLEAIALARAEDLVMFEHRDLHEGNLCVKQVKPSREMGARLEGFFGYSGLDITILDYGLSRAEDLSVNDAKPVSFDLERDLSLFTSTHATQCEAYRQMRSFLLRADRKCLPPEAHNIPYAKGVDGPLSWDAYAPYTNVLWLAYLYDYLVDNFVGPKKELVHFKKETSEMWAYLNPNADESMPCFGCAADIVCFAVEAGWMSQEQLIGAEESMLEREDSIIVSREEAEAETSVARRSRKRLD